MKLSEVQSNQIVKLDNLIMLKLPNGEFDCALPGSKLKSGKFPMADITVHPASKSEMINAIERAKHDNDWYSLLLKELMLKRLESIN